MSLAVRTLDGGTRALDRDALRGFAGALLEGSDPGYDAARRGWNGMIDRRPALIARCGRPEDVVLAVRVAREHRLLLSVRGGGHHIAGLGVCDGGLMLDLSPMRVVTVDPARRIARAEAGCVLGDVDRATQRHGLAAVLGMVSDTGIAGLTVGGGFGYLTRRHGWTCDTVASMDVVTADGRLVRAAPDENPELFFALRGGGGNFGVVTAFEYRLFPVGPEIVGGPVMWPGDDAPEVLRLYRELAAAAPRELTCVCGLRTGPDGKPVVSLSVCHTGDLADGDRVAQALRGFRRPIAALIGRRSYVATQSMLDGFQPAGRRYYFKSHHVARLDDGLLDVVAAQRERFVSPFSSLLLVQLGGALNELPADHAPMGHRDAAFVLAIGAAWEDAGRDAANIAWARDAWAATRPFATGSEYVNFMNADEGAERTAAAYDPRTLERLAALKRRLDPGDLFRHNRRITPA